MPPIKRSWLTIPGLSSKPRIRKVVDADCAAPPDAAAAVALKSPPSDDVGWKIVR